VASSDSASSSIKKSGKTQRIIVVRQYMSIKANIAKYIRNTLLSHKQTAESV